MNILNNFYDIFQKKATNDLYLIIKLIILSTCSIKAQLSIIILPDILSKKYGYTFHGSELFYYLFPVVLFKTEFFDRK